MVLGRKGASPRPALLVPDEQTWTVLGRDPVTLGYTPAWNPGRVAAVLAPRRVPDSLASAIAALRDLMPSDVTDERTALPLFEAAAAQPGAAGDAEDVRPPDSHDEHSSHSQHPALLSEHAGQDPHADHEKKDGHDHEAQRSATHGAHDEAAEPAQDAHGGDGGHAGHGGHHDTMAIVGEPSADGLVMEPIPLTYGPLATPFPGGLIAEVTLDGDVVDDGTVLPTLQVDVTGDGAAVPDPLSPVAWSLAMADPSGEDDAALQWLAVAAIELERAISHLAWLRSLARLLNWSPLSDACTRALAAIQVSREVVPVGGAPEAWLRAALGEPDVRAGRAALRELVALVCGSRMLRWRLKHRAELTASDVRDLGLSGPIARASGDARDVRSTDPRYRDLGFELLTQTDGDAYARTLMRAEEAAQALDLVDAALAAEPGPVRDVASAVEGPRGPLQASRDQDRWRFFAPGAKEAAAVAADAMVWLEWSSALLVLASFDLSPWRVGG